MSRRYLKPAFRITKLSICLALFLLTISTRSRAQDAQPAVTGVVSDDYGHALPGVEIISKKNRTVLALSDSSGHFSLSLDPGDAMVFQHPDYYSVQKNGNGSAIAVRLNKRHLLSPTIVNTLYQQQTADQLLGAVSSIYNNQLVTTPESQYSFALPGRLPGLYTQQTSGWVTKGTVPLINPDVFLWVERMAGTEGMQGPNDNTQMQLKLRGQTPVTIVDGIQRNIFSLPPESIESISVLKDALSTILLGQQSSRGVLLVTTRRPEKGAPRVSFTAQTGIQTPLNLPRPLPSHQYAWLYNEALENSGREPVYSAEDFQAYRDGTDPLSYPNVNWYKTALRKNAPMSRYDLNVTGGSDIARYTISLGYMNKQGLFRQDPATPYKTNAEIQRYTVNSHVDVNISPEFNVGLDIFGRIENTNEPGAGIENIFNTLIVTPNNAYPLFNADGSLGGNQVYSNNIYGMATQSGYLVGHNRDVMANLDLKYDFKKWVPGLWSRFMGNVAVSSTDLIDRSKGFPVFGAVSLPGGGTGYNRFGNAYDQRNVFSLTSFAQYWYGQFSLGYDHQWGRNTINAMLFADQRQATIGYDLPSKATNLAAKLNYHLDNKYFAEAAVNYSGFDRFVKGDQFGLFYAGGLGWDMAKEYFIKDNLSWIQKFKWRATYGLTGNANVGYFVYEQFYKDNYFSGYYFGDVWQSGGVENSPLPNVNPTWEKAHKFNIGVDLSMIRNKVQLTADYFVDNYSDLMQLRGKANPLIGNSYPLENIGKHRYSGAEVSITYQDRAGNLNWFITGNIGLMKTKVLYMDEMRRMYDWNRRTGQQVGQMFGYLSDGLYNSQAEVNNSVKPEGLNPVPGDIKYKDLNGDGVINDFDMAPIGTTQPLIFFGWNFGLSYKGFDVNVLFQGAANRSLYLSGPGAVPFHASVNGQAWEHNISRWTPQTAAAAASPRLTSGINQNNNLTSDYWIRSGNYLRLKNLEIGYSIPHTLTKKLRLGDVRVFANGLNLLTFTGNDQIDPEVSAQTSGAVYPIQQVTNMGVTIRL